MKRLWLVSFLGEFLIKSLNTVYNKQKFIVRYFKDLFEESFLSIVAEARNISENITISVTFQPSECTIAPSELTIKIPHGKVLIRVGHDGEAW